MNSPYVVPSYKSKAFNCPICNAFSHQVWYPVHARFYGDIEELPNYMDNKFPSYPTGEVDSILSSSVQFVKQEPRDTYVRGLDGIAVSECVKCGSLAIWIREQMIHPFQSTAPYPNADMPEDVKKDFIEAREIVERSPRAAAALLRLATERLVIHLGGDPDSKINTNIQFLVDNKGLPVRIQRALDVLRVVGNEAVHPGTIDVDDKEVAIDLFNWINDIVTMMITNEKLIDEHYHSLPPDKLKGIEKRNKRA